MHTLRKLIFYLSLLLVTFPSIAAEEIPEINFEKFTLANGLRVIVHEDHKIPVVAVNCLLIDAILKIESESIFIPYSRLAIP